MQDWNMTDKVAGVENAGLEIDGQKYLRNGSIDRKSEKHFINYNPFHVG